MFSGSVSICKYDLQLNLASIAILEMHCIQFVFWGSVKLFVTV